MYKNTLLILLLAVSAFAAEVEITSNRFEGDDKSGVSKFSGNVKVVRGGDVITSDMLFVYFDRERKPYKFEAIGSAKFELKEGEQKSYRGSANKIVYLPNQKEYILEGDSYVEYIEERRKVYGEHIVVNDLTKKATVVGKEGGRPAKFIFFVEDKNETKKR